MTNKTELWDQLCKTDPRHTSKFQRAGGFKGTAIKPIWSFHRMTEVFGPCGEGWGVGEPTFQVIPAGDEIMVFCTASIWHGSKERTVFGVGGDKVVSKFSSGLRSDDEAFKKAFTDAITNALKLIGVGGDVHMGRFDDSKYVSALTAEFNEPKHVTHDTMPDDILDVPEQDVIERDDGIQVLTVDAQRPIFSELQNELIACETVDDCKRWGVRAKSRASRLSGNWHKMLQAKYIEHLRSIERRDALEYVEKATA